MNKIIFYAPVGNLVKGFKNGGAEAGCRKTIEILQKEGYEILLVEKPAKKSESKIAAIVLVFELFWVWLKLIFIFLTNRKSVLHIAGFYLNQVYFEWLIIKTAQKLDIRTIYEIRNGGMIDTFHEGSPRYKRFMKSILIDSSTILCQGYDYVVFLKEYLNRESVFYPNYIMDDFITDNETDRENEQIIKLIYFGRVVPDKNVEFIIDICNELKVMYIPFVLDIIGGYEEEYYELLTNKIKYYNLEKEVIFHGRKDFKEIYSYLKSAHFFIFPSKEKREGQSNSLTEAMGCGVVPIVSTAGFNSRIVEDDSLVIPLFFASEYANTVVGIWNQDQWKIKSNAAYKRVIENYTESIVKKSLLKAYNNLN